jgi:hypothetical protein
MATDERSERDRLDDDKIRAEIMKLIAESQKYRAEAKWFPFVATAGVFAAAVAFVKLLLH